MHRWWRRLAHMSLFAFTALGLTVLLEGCGGGGSSETPIPPPRITREPVSQTVSEGTAVSFSVETTGSGISYQWLRDGIAIADATQANYTLISTTNADSGSLWAVRVSNQGGSVTSQSAVLTVRAVSQPQLRLVAGDPGGIGNIDGVGRWARFNNITGITVNADNLIYTIDRDNATLRMVTPDGQVRTLAGQAGLKGMVDGQGSAAQFTDLRDVAAMPDGSLLVADGGRLRRVTSAGMVTTLATPGLPDAQALAVDRRGVAYISTGSSIWQMQPGRAPTAYAGRHGIFASTEGALTFARLQQITDLAIASDGTIHVAQEGPRLSKIDPSGMVRNVMDQETAGPKFQYLGGIAVDANDTLWVANHQQILSKIGSDGSVIAASPAAEQLRVDLDYCTPIAMAFRPTGELVFTCRGIVQIDSMGRYREVAGQALKSTTDVVDGMSMASDRDGNLLVSHVLPNFQLGITRYASATGQKQPFTSGTATVQIGAKDTVSDWFHPPVGMGFNASGELMIANPFVGISPIPFSETSVLGGAIYGVSGQGISETYARWSRADTPLISPANLVTDHQGNAWFIDLKSERLMQRSGSGVLNVWAPVGQTFDRIQRSDVYTYPVIGGIGEVYVTNRSTRSIARADRNQITHWIGQPQAQTVIDGPANVATFLSPGPGVVDTRGNLYVADGELIRRISPNGNVVTVAGSAGRVGITTGGLPGTLGQVRSLALASDQTMFLLVDRALLRIDLPPAP